MNDNEIIKALECCFDGYCGACAFDDNLNLNCKDRLIENALNLIERQKAEIDKLNTLFDSSQDNSFNAIHLLYEMREKFNRQKVELDKKDTEIDVLIQKKEALRDENSELKAEVERLRNTVKTEFLTVREKLKLSQSDIVEIRAEAIKEFAERLKRNHITKDDKGKVHLLIEYDEFDNLVKEMMEGGVLDGI